MEAVMIRSIFAFFIMVALLAGCDGGKMQGMSNPELAAKHDECVRKDPSSPGRVTACENIKKECANRRKDGNYAC